jgi:hypothetical protein
VEYSDIKSEYRLQADSGDKWGSAMGARFDICETLHRRDADIPASWEFSPGAGLFGVDDEPETYFGEIIRDADSADLVRFGNVLARYTDWLRAADLDY